MAEEIRYADKTGETIITGKTWSPLRGGKVTDYSFTAVGGATTYVDVAVGASTRTNEYQDLWYVITSGTGAGQAATLIDSYDPSLGANGRAFFVDALATAPDATSVGRFFLAEKRCLTNTGDDLDSFAMTQEAVAGGTGNTWWRHGADASTKSRPFNPSISKAAGSGTFGSTGTKGMVVVAKYSTLVTGPSLEQTSTLTATTQEITLTWDAVPGSPTNLLVYGTDTPGTYGGSSLLATISGAATSYTWTGTAGTSGSPPTSNTTGGPSPAYGTPPASGSMINGALTVPALVYGRDYWFWVSLVIPTGTPAGDGAMRRHAAPEA
jgi:hypothetical protein